MAAGERKPPAVVAITLVMNGVDGVIRVVPFGPGTRPCAEAAVEGIGGASSQRVPPWQAADEKLKEAAPRISSFVGEVNRTTPSRQLEVMQLLGPTAVDISDVTISVVLAAPLAPAKKTASRWFSHPSSLILSAAGEHSTASSVEPGAAPVTVIFTAWPLTRWLLGVTITLGLLEARIGGAALARVEVVTERATRATRTSTPSPTFVPTWVSQGCRDRRPRRAPLGPTTDGTYQRHVSRRGDQAVETKRVRLFGGLVTACPHVSGRSVNRDVMRALRPAGPQPRVPVRQSGSLDRLIEEASARITRLKPLAAYSAAAAGGVIIDIRSPDARELHGVIPGSLHIPRTVLEWRIALGSPWRNPHLGGADQQLILICDHGYSSILAASNLVELGFHRAGDVVGGFEAWNVNGFPVKPCPPRVATVVGLPGTGPPED